MMVLKFKNILKFDLFINQIIVQFLNKKWFLNNWLTISGILKLWLTTA